MRGGARKHPRASCLELFVKRLHTVAFFSVVCYDIFMELIAAFDIGDRRIGVAFSDPFGKYAIPSDTYFRMGNFREDVKNIAAIARSHGAACIVCGLPLNEDGTESVQSEKTRCFAEALAKEAGLPVVLEDERYTTRAARQDLAALGVTVKRDKKKKSIDSHAAAYILENYLAQIRSETMKEKENNYEEEDNIVELIDDSGKTYRYEHLMTFDYKNEWYCALTPAEPPEESEADDEGEDVAIFRIAGSEEDEHLEVVEDDALLDELFDEFCRLYDEEDGEDGGE